MPASLRQRHPVAPQQHVDRIQRVSRPLSFAWLGLLVDLFVLCSARGDGHAPPRILDLNQNSVAGLAQWM
jgi:hypothetical protein